MAQSKLTGTTHSAHSQQKKGSKNSNSDKAIGLDKKQTKSPKGLELRQAAQKILAAVIDKKTSLDGLLDKTHGQSSYLKFEERDQALVRAILQVALRYRGQLSARINALLQKPLPKGARSLEHILHIGAAQILYLDIPNHAAIDLAVETAKRNPQTKRFASLVNAILRALSRQVAGKKTKQHDALQEQDACTQVEKPSNIDVTLAYDAASLVPKWFWQMLVHDYGEKQAKVIVEAQITPAPLDVSVKDAPEKWAQELDGYLLPFGSVRLSGDKTTITALNGFHDGAWWIQNVAASLPARLMGDIKGQNIADLCAAPGGKTAQLALAGAQVTAVDVSANRLKRLQQNLDRLHLKAATWKGDLRKLAKTENFTLFDMVLLDAPCSSTGTVRRHPDVMWTKTADDVAHLAQVQKELLTSSLDLVKSGGTIIFCNCSLAKEEGEELIKAFLNTHKDKVRLMAFTEDDIKGLLCRHSLDMPETDALVSGLINKDGFLRTTPADLPNKDKLLAGMDGFFAARLQKI